MDEHLTGKKMGVVWPLFLQEQEILCSYGHHSFILWLFFHILFSLQSLDQLPV